MQKVAAANGSLFMNGNMSGGLPIHIGKYLDDYLRIGYSPQGFIPSSSTLDSMIEDLTGQWGISFSSILPKELVLQYEFPVYNSRTLRLTTYYDGKKVSEYRTEFASEPPRANKGVLKGSITIPPRSNNG